MGTYRPESLYTVGTRASAMPVFPPEGSEGNDQQRKSQLYLHYMVTEFWQFLQKYNMPLLPSYNEFEERNKNTQKKQDLYRRITLLISYMKMTQEDKKRVHRFSPRRIVYSLVNIYREKKVVKLLSKNPRFVKRALSNENDIKIFSQKGQETLNQLKAKSDLLSKVPAHEDFKQELDLQSDESKKTTISPPPALFSSQYAREHGMESFPTSEKEELRDSIDIEIEKTDNMSEDKENLDRSSMVVLSDLSMKPDLSDEFAKRKMMVPQNHSTWQHQPVDTTTRSNLINPRYGIRLS